MEVSLSKIRVVLNRLTFPAGGDILALIWYTLFIVEHHQDVTSTNIAQPLLDFVNESVKLNCFGEAIYSLTGVSFILKAVQQRKESIKWRLVINALPVFMRGKLKEDTAHFVVSLDWMSIQTRL